MADKIKPAAALKRLDSLVGKWVTELRLNDGTTRTDFAITGTDTYYWYSGGGFLVHEVDVRMDGAPYQVTEFIGGYDKKSDTYPMRSFDSQGNFQEMTASVDKDGVWTFGDKNSRATLTIAKDGDSMKSHWEQSKDGKKWSPWMDMKFTRIR